MADIQSPVPGTFYHKPSPEEAPFKSEGDSVSAGETIGLVEVMKSFIEVQAEADGTFGGYTAENESAVAAGDVLATLK
ncbi:acetyl-CoA carboxylase biotin carboxyl carrier protein subunit (plasmid) [Sulfitobacter alexandrii]|uniref:Biotin carboxyl carrier protein of acetyl-CoA carboxylase n=1 Tax=Sulfitobacter alexandrii TaxID=1917485 RepID=A0A1J0WMV8_9RHOB|nr:acetyl-CoA carboxylase [Sulfitobacter alexandrii]APE45597.1 acetyl-CoA carboxylase biotin carboxyl carrier protein subunit [Sulfitobacter alexandrii]